MKKHAEGKDSIQAEKKNDNYKCVYDVTEGSFSFSKKVASSTGKATSSVFKT
jgi:hypothetical protein